MNKADNEAGSRSIDSLINYETVKVSGCTSGLGKDHHSEWSYRPRRKQEPDTLLASHQTIVQSGQTWSENDLIFSLRSLGKGLSMKNYSGTSK